MDGAEDADRLSIFLAGRLAGPVLRMPKNGADRLEIERPSASEAPSTGDLPPRCRVARVVSFVNEPNDVRKPVTWPGCRGIGQALVCRRD